MVRARSLNARSMRFSMVLSERLSRPTSVFGVAPPRRWLKSPSAIAAAVCSTSRSGANVVVTSIRVRAGGGGDDHGRELARAGERLRRDQSAVRRPAVVAGQRVTADRHGLGLGEGEFGGDRRPVGGRDVRPVRLDQVAVGVVQRREVVRRAGVGRDLVLVRRRSVQIRVDVGGTRRRRELCVQLLEQHGLQHRHGADAGHEQPERQHEHGHPGDLRAQSMQG